MSESYLTFKVKEEYFAAHVKYVQNIIEVGHITAVPQSPDYMLGVLNLRGVVLPILDMRRKFGLVYKEPDSNSCIIVLELNLEGEEIVIGALVDEVSEVIEINESEIQDAPQIGVKHNSNFIQGLYLKEGSFTMLLKLEYLFSLEVINLIKTASETSQKLVV